jgi:GDPmannose 4,6-dehydratase
MAFKEAGISLSWEGKGVAEKGINQADGKTLVEIDPRYFRPAEVDILIGDPSKAKSKLGWEPRVKLPELVRMMMEHDIELAKREVHLKDGGYKTENYFE